MRALPHLRNEALYQVVANSFDDAFDANSTICTLTQSGKITGQLIVQTALEIERFVDHIAVSSEPGFQDTASAYQNHVCSIPNWDFPHLAKEYYTKIPQFFSIYKPTLNYSPKVNLFFEVAAVIGYPHNFSSDPNQIVHHTDNIFQNADYFSALIKFIRLQTNSNQIEKKTLSRTTRSERINESCVDYVDALFKKSPTLQIARIDLGYKPEFGYERSLKMIRGHLVKILKQNAQANFNQQHCGHISKIEYGSPDGYRIHLILFFNTSPQFCIFTRIHQIGEYWSSVVTNFSGTSFSCIEGFNFYKKMAIGIISRADKVKRAELKQTIAYLCKSEDLLRVDSKDGRLQTISHGLILPVKFKKTRHPKQILDTTKLYGDASWTSQSNRYLTV